MVDMNFKMHQSDMFRQLQLTGVIKMFRFGDLSLGRLLEFWSVSALSHAEEAPGAQCGDLQLCIVTRIAVA